jgi:hypothetical protein
MPLFPPRRLRGGHAGEVPTGKVAIARIEADGEGLAGEEDREGQTQSRYFSRPIFGSQARLDSDSSAQDSSKPSGGEEDWGPFHIGCATSCVWSDEEALHKCLKASIESSPVFQHTCYIVSSAMQLEGAEGT